MNKYVVNVSHTWKGSTQFEFDSQDDAQAFADKVNGGDLGAIVDAGDIDTSGVGLTDFAAGRVAQDRG